MTRDGQCDEGTDSVSGLAPINTFGQNHLREGDESDTLPKLARIEPKMKAAANRIECLHGQLAARIIDCSDRPTKRGFGRGIGRDS